MKRTLTRRHEQLFAALTDRFETRAVISQRAGLAAYGNASRSSFEDLVDAGLAEATDEDCGFTVERVYRRRPGAQLHGDPTPPADDPAVPPRVFARLQLPVAPGDQREFPAWPGVTWTVDTVKVADDHRDAKCTLIRAAA